MAPWGVPTSDQAVLTIQILILILISISILKLSVQAEMASGVIPGRPNAG